MEESVASVEAGSVTESALWEAWLRGEPPAAVPIIDAHAHLGRLAEFHIPGGGRAEDLLREMDRLGIRCCLSAPFAAWAGELGEGHDEIARIAKLYPGRFYGYCVYNPAFGVERSLHELESRLACPEFVGIKIAPSTHGFAADDPDYAPMWDFANRRGLVVLTHSWRGSAEDDPRRFESIARRYPRVRILLGHSGGDVQGMVSAARVASEAENIYLELASSHTPLGILEWMVATVGAERILFGSDMPFLDPRWKLGQVLGARIPDAAKEKILGENARRLFGLEV